MPQPKFFPKAPTPVYEIDHFEASYEVPANLTEIQTDSSDTINLGEWFDSGGYYINPLRAEARRQVGYMEPNGSLRLMTMQRGGRQTNHTPLKCIETVSQDKLLSTQKTTKKSVFCSTRTG